MRRAAVYVRVSTSEQTTENQERELREVAERMGWQIVKVYRDQGISGAKGREKRPAFDLLCRDAAQRRFDVIMAWSVDRLGRSLQDSSASYRSSMRCASISSCTNKGWIRTPGGKAMFQMMGVFAEF